MLSSSHAPGLEWIANKFDHRIAALEAKVRALESSQGERGPLRRPFATPPAGDGGDGESTGESGDGSSSEDALGHDEKLMKREITHESLSLGHESRGFEFNASAWDAAICAGHPAVGKVGSCIVVLLVFMNMLIQLVFCYIVKTAFTQDPYDGEIRQGLQWWRTGIAHGAESVDLASRTTLATRVCSFDEALSTSATQKTVASDVNDYGWTWSMSGPVMCTLALLCWFLIITNEVSKVVRFALATCRLKKSRRTQFYESSDGSITLKSISYERLMFICLVQAVRMFIAMALGWWGIEYLINTATTQDLLLNAVALQFVLDVDELLFSLIAPDGVQMLISRLAPIPIPRAFEWGGANITSITMLLVPVGLSMLAVVTSLAPALVERKAAWDAVCGGNKDFAVASDAIGRVHWSKTLKYDDNLYMKTGYLRKAVESIIENDMTASMNQPRMSLALYETSLDNLLHRVRDQTIEEAAHDSSCIDGDDASLARGSQGHERQGQWILGKSILQSAIGVRFYDNSSSESEAIESCADVIPYCQGVELTSVRARQWCPVTCGCSSMLSGLLLDGPSLGCPVVCTDILQSTVNSEDCSSRSREDTLADPRFVAYARGARALFAQEGYSDPTLVALAERMLEIGCDAVENGGEAGLALCKGKIEIYSTERAFRSAWTLCPVACGCDGSGLPGSKRTWTPAAAFDPNEVLQLRGACNRQFSLTQDYYFMGSTENWSPMFRSPSGDYIYYGPDCTRGGKANRWIISPALCTSGYVDAFLGTDDGSRPPAAGTWFMACSAGWRDTNLTLTVRTAQPGYG